MILSGGAKCTFSETYMKSDVQMIIVTVNGRPRVD